MSALSAPGGAPLSFVPTLSHLSERPGSWAFGVNRAGFIFQKRARNAFVKIILYYLSAFLKSEFGIIIQALKPTVLTKTPTAFFKLLLDQRTSRFR